MEVRRVPFSRPRRGVRGLCREPIEEIALLQSITAPVNRPWMCGTEDPPVQVHAVAGIQRLEISAKPRDEAFIRKGHQAI